MLPHTRVPQLCLLHLVEVGTSGPNLVTIISSLSSTRSHAMLSSPVLTWLAPGLKVF